MENLVTAYATILNDPDLRRTAVGEVHRSRRGLRPRPVARCYACGRRPHRECSQLVPSQRPASWIPDRPARFKPKEVCHVRPAAHEGCNRSTPA